MRKEEQLQVLLYSKLVKDFDEYMDVLIAGGREKLKESIAELSTKHDMLLEFRHFPPLDGTNLKALLNQKHPLDFLYKEWDKDTDLQFQELHFAIVSIAEREAQRLAKQKSEHER